MDDYKKVLELCPWCDGLIRVWPAMIYKGYKVSCENDCFSMPARPDVCFATIEEGVDFVNKRVK